MRHSQLLFKRYPCVDDAIRNGDIPCVRAMMMSRDPSLVKDIHTVSRYLGEKNMCIDDLVSMATATSPNGGGSNEDDVYLHIAYGAATCGHKDLIEWSLQRGVTDYNNLAYHAACNGYREIVANMIKRGADDFNHIARGAAMHGYRDIVTNMISLGANDYNGIALSAAHNGYQEIMVDMMKAGATNIDKVIDVAVSNGYDDNILQNIV